MLTSLFERSNFNVTDEVWVELSRSNSVRDKLGEAVKACISPIIYHHGNECKLRA